VLLQPQSMNEGDIAGGRLPLEIVRRPLRLGRGYITHPTTGAIISVALPLTELRDGAARAERAESALGHGDARRFPPWDHVEREELRRAGRTRTTDAAAARGHDSSRRRGTRARAAGRAADRVAARARQAGDAAASCPASAPPPDQLEWLRTMTESPLYTLTDAQNGADWLGSDAFRLRELPASPSFLADVGSSRCPPSWSGRCCAGST
jgi:hypothetical protein